MEVPDWNVLMTDAQVSLEVLSNDVYAALFKFTWGDSHIARYCNWPENIVSNGDTFTANPYIRYIMEKGQHGGTEDSPVNVEAPMTLEPFDTLVQLTDHAPVKCRIDEVSPNNPDDR